MKSRTLLTILRSWWWRLSGKRVCVTPAIRESLQISELGFAPTPEELEWLSILLRYDYVADEINVRVNRRLQLWIRLSLHLGLPDAQTQT